MNVRKGSKPPFSEYPGNGRFRANSVAKLFSGCRIVIIESLYQMKRIILTEIGTATNQCYAKFPWTEFCNRIPPEDAMRLKDAASCSFSLLTVI